MNKKATWNGNARGISFFYYFFASRTMVFWQFQKLPPTMENAQTKKILKKSPIYWRIYQDDEAKKPNRSHNLH